MTSTYSRGPPTASLALPVRLSAATMEFRFGTSTTAAAASASLLLLLLVRGALAACLAAAKPAAVSRIACSSGTRAAMYLQLQLGQECKVLLGTQCCCRTTLTTTVTARILAVYITSCTLPMPK
eukprot:5909-Heterococcus_DN1.PRE.5